MSQQGLRQASARQISLTTEPNNYDGDLRLAFEAEVTIPADATFNEAQLMFLNGRLGATYTNINEAMQIFADSKGAFNFSSLWTLDT